MLLFRRFIANCLTDRSRAIRTTALCLLLHYICLATGVGLPLHLRAAVTIMGAEEYPCAGRGCGCRSAEQCRKACCCFSKAEREAWFAQRKRSPSCCKPNALAAKNCCSHKAKTSQRESKSHDSPWVRYWEALRCGGGESSPEILSVPVSLPAVFTNSLEQLSQISTRFLPEFDPHYISPRFSPAAPPPRFA